MAADDGSSHDKMEAGMLPPVGVDLVQRSGVQGCNPGAGLAGMRPSAVKKGDARSAKIFEVGRLGHGRRPGQNWGWAFRSEV